MQVVTYDDITMKITAIDIAIITTGILNFGEGIDIINKQKENSAKIIHISKILNLLLY